MMLDHTGFDDLGARLHKAIDICGQYEKKVAVTGRSDGATTQEFGDYVMATVEDSQLESSWEDYVSAS